MLFLAVALRGSGGAEATASKDSGASGVDTPGDRAVVAADNSFGLKLFNALLARSGRASPNVALSPLSLSLALRINHGGAGTSTRIAMAQPLDPDPKVALSVANSIFAMVGDPADAPAAVNAWVDGKTRGLVPKLLSPDLPPSAFKDAIIANALYFKGEWTTSFDPAATAQAPFMRGDGIQVSVPLMRQTSTFPYFQGTLSGIPFQAVRLPYGAGRMDMLILLPESGSNLENFAAGLTGAALQSWSFASANLSIALPRFTSGYSSALRPALTSLGMGIESTPGAQAVSEVYHATVVEVDEAGTVAAAATGDLTMTMDHPFIWAIEDDKTGVLLFLGVLADPTAARLG